MEQTDKRRLTVEHILQASKMPLWCKASKEGMEQNLNPVVLKNDFVESAADHCLFHCEK